MKDFELIDGIVFSKMINAGATNLSAHVEQINDLNVFPIPDGDTGDNMLMTIRGGVSDASSARICDASERASRGMLLSARGNSGVILSQFFEGIKNGLASLEQVDALSLGKAFSQGVKQAYLSVITPTEGTILTVAREATEVACASEPETPLEFLKCFLKEAKSSLLRTPELLPVLKKAGVVDSGGAGLIYIIEGMVKYLSGEELDSSNDTPSRNEELDFDAFDENSVLEFGYCTELLIRLQASKVDNISIFNEKMLVSELSDIGDSIVSVKNGSIIKLHIHTMTPDKVLSLCQKYGEFLKVKIENMSLQHNNTVIKQAGTPKRERQKFGVVAVASGEGLKQFFLDSGADVVVDGGQSTNPSTEAFLSAFDEVNADTVFVFPNNGNVILTAKQASKLYKSSDVRVIESHSIGEGYSSLSMLDTSSGNADVIFDELTDALKGVVSAEISHCIRDAVYDGFDLHAGDFVAICSKSLICADKDRVSAVTCAIERLGVSEREICILIYGKDTDEAEANELSELLCSKYPSTEIYLVNGHQEVYDYIIIMP